MELASVGSAISPSELVLLRGRDFAGKAVLGNVALPDGEKVAADALGKALLETAVLADEAAGFLRLEPREKKRFLGLGKTRVLFATPGPRAASWPEGSLESRVASVVRRSPQASEVEDVLWAAIGQDARAPWAFVADLAKHGLATRRLLEVEEKRTLKVLRTLEYRLPEPTRALAEATDPQPIRAALDALSRERPEVARLLDHAVAAAIRRRTEETDDGAG
jgi:hypothetical protein